MLKTLTLNMGKSLGNILQTGEQAEVYAYALELLLMVLINLVLVILAAFCLQIVPTTLAFLAVFIPFRGWGGGVHMSTFPRCLVVGSSLMLGSAYFASVEMMNRLPLEVLLVVGLMFVLICTLKWVPANICRNPTNSAETLKRQKRKMLITVFIWAGSVSAFIALQYNDLALAMILGAIVSAVLISPFGFKLIGSVDRMLN